MSSLKKVNINNTDKQKVACKLFCITFNIKCLFILKYLNLYFNERDIF